MEGYRTLPYRQGAGAYELIEHERPDAVIMDIRMEHPRAGLAVLQRLRHDPATAAIPVLICTADVPFTREWARTLGEPAARWSPSPSRSTTCSSPSPA